MRRFRPLLLKESRCIWSTMETVTMPSAVVMDSVRRIVNERTNVRVRNADRISETAIHVRSSRLVTPDMPTPVQKYGWVEME